MDMKLLVFISLFSFWTKLQNIYSLSSNFYTGATLLTDTWLSCYMYLQTAVLVTFSSGVHATCLADIPVLHSNSLIDTVMH